MQWTHPCYSQLYMCELFKLPWLKNSKIFPSIKTPIFLALHCFFLSIHNTRELLTQGNFLKVFLLSDFLVKRPKKKIPMQTITSPHTSTERIKTAFQAKCTTINLQTYRIWVLILAGRIQQYQHLSLIPIYTLKIKPSRSNGQKICKLLPAHMTTYCYSWFFKSERLTYHASCQFASGS